MNGTEKYFNRRVQNKKGVAFIGYDETTNEVTSSAPTLVLRGQQTAAQTITNPGGISNTADTVFIDTGAFESPSSNGAWTCLTEGTYLVYMSYRNSGVDIVGSTNRVVVQIRRNGTSLIEASAQIPSSANYGNSNSATVSQFFEVGDTLDVFLSSASTSFVCLRCDLFVTRL